MILFATKRIKANYISLIRKYPKGMPNRLEEFDKWAASWNQPHINNYYDYFLNGETQQHEMWMPDC